MSEVWSLKSEGWGLRDEVWRLRSEVGGLRSKDWGLKSEGWNLKSEVWSLKSECWGLRYEVWGCDFAKMIPGELTINKINLRFLVISAELGYLQIPWIKEITINRTLTENCCSFLYICLWLFKYTKNSAVFFYFIWLCHSKCRMNHIFIIGIYTGGL